MPSVTFIEPDGRAVTIVVAAGTTVRDAACDNSVAGIDGDCGGACACATCHVYVDPEWIAKTGTPEPDGMEANMLQFADGVGATSRLSCQITLDDALDGLVVRVPADQH